MVVACDGAATTTKMTTTATTTPTTTGAAAVGCNDDGYLAHSRVLFGDGYSLLLFICCRCASNGATNYKLAQMGAGFWGLVDVQNTRAEQAAATGGAAVARRRCGRSVFRLFCHVKIQ